MRLPACIYISREKTLLLVAVAIAAEELINTTGGIDELVLASVEWVAGRSDFELYEGVLNTINLDGLFGGNGGTRDESHVVRHVLECYRTIVFWMEILLHFFLVL